MPTKEKKAEKKSKDAVAMVHFFQTMTDPHTRIEYIRKKDRTKQGVMISCKDPLNSDHVLIGFSMCRLAFDDFDKVEGRIEKKDLGKLIAFKRAMKYGTLTSFMAYSIKIKVKSANRVYIPQTVFDNLGDFVQAAYKYYKECSFPAWVVNAFPPVVDEEE